MNPASVIEEQVFRDCVRGFLPCFEMRLVNALDLERLEKCLGAGVIIRRFGTTHALNAADGSDLAPEVP